MASYVKEAETQMYILGKTGMHKYYYFVRRLDMTGFRDV